MKIVVFDDRYKMFYGAQQQAVEIAAQARDHGHDVTFLTTAEGVLAEAARGRGLHVRIETPPEAWLQFERKALGTGLQRLRVTTQMLAFSRRLAAVIRDTQTELVIVSNVRTALTLVWSRLTPRVPIVLYAQNNIPMGPFAVVAALVSSRIGMIGPSTIRTFPGPLHRFVHGRSFPWPGGRDLSHFAPSPEPVLPAGEPATVLTIASLTRRKGIHDLIDALALVSDSGRPVRLVVVGGTVGAESEAYADGLRKQAERLGVETEFAGWRDDVRPALASCHLFALASYEEGLPGVLIEAMATERACVTTRAGDAGRLVDEGDAGVSVDVGDVDGLASGIRALLTDPHRRSAHAASGRQYVLATLGVEKLYEDLAAGTDNLFQGS